MGDDNSTYPSRRRLIKTSGVLGGLGLAGCLGFGGDGDDSDGKIEIGAPNAITGGFGFITKRVSKSWEAVAASINEAGGPLDREIKLLERDTEVNPQVAREVVDQMITVDEVQVIVSLQSSEILPNWDWLQQQEVPVVTNYPGARELDQLGGDGGNPGDLSQSEWVWRTMVSDSFDTINDVVYATDQGIESMVILNDAVEGERSYALGVEDAGRVVDGVEVVERVEAERGQTSYSTQLDRLFDNDPDAIVFVTTPEDLPTMIRDYNDAGYESAVFLYNGLNGDDIIESSGDQFPERTYMSLSGASGPYYDGFVDLFDEYHGTENLGENNLPWVISAYDSLVVTALAIHRAGEYDAAAIQQNIGPVSRAGENKVTVNTFAEGKEALDNGDEIQFEGAFTKTNFDNKGNAAGAVNTLRVHADGYEKLGTTDPERLREVYTDSDYKVSKP